MSPSSLLLRKRPMVIAGSIVLGLAVLLLAARPYFRASPPAVAPSKRVADFSLLDQDGRFHQLSRYAGSRAVVLFVHGIGCNIVRDSFPALSELKARYTVRESDFLMPSRRRHPEPDEGLIQRAWRRVGYEVDRVLNARWLAQAKQRNVSFLMINANPQDDRAALRAEVAAYGLDIPILKDELQLVARDLGIARTAEAIVIDTRTWHVAYRGPVDDRMGFETRKKDATHRYLHDAIEALLDGRVVEAPAPFGDAGCAITQEISRIEGRAATYPRDVAPLLIDKCVPCHQKGGAGPWAMDRHATVKGWSAMMREVVANRRMPPWHADPLIGSFKNDRALTNEQIRMLVDWIDAGAPRGEGDDPLAARPQGADPEWPLGKPDLVIEAPLQVIPATGVLDYRYGEVALPLDHDVWVRAVHLKPSNTAVVHHQFVFLKFPAHLKSDQHDANNGINGFFAAYVPGGPVEPFPENTGRLMPKGTILQFQQHYAPVGRATSDRTRLAIYLHPRPPPRELVIQSAANTRFRIPPGLAQHPVEARFVFDRDAQIHALFPHMHVRGSRVRFEARHPNGRTETLLSVPNYQFNWQSTYSPKTPIPVAAGTELRVSGAFDNSPSNPANPDPSRAVTWGDRTDDEMFIGYVLYSVPVGTQVAETHDGAR